MKYAPFDRRHLLLGSVACGLSLTSGLARAKENSSGSARAVLPSMTEGPFYPPLRWRERHPNSSDWDADLTRVMRGKESFTAQGEHLELRLTVIDSKGRSIDRAEVEIWQCDVNAVYQHPEVRNHLSLMDPGFQGFGAARTGREGPVRFRTIRPVPYPGRTPHIHLKLRHASFGEWTSQLFVANDPGNERDGIWRRLAIPSRDAITMQLMPAQDGSGLRWQVDQAVVLPA